MSQITYAELQKMMLDPTVPDEELRQYLTLSPSESRPLRPVLVPKPEMVDLQPGELEIESAMEIGNDLCRLRQRLKFKRRKLFGDTSPVIVAEGDSWTQFPILITDLVDHLNEDFLVWNVGAAGDTASNMVYGELGPGKQEYLKALKSRQKDVKAFLFSGAGNDVIGEDSHGEPVLFKLVKPFNGSMDAVSHINFTQFAETFSFLKKAYRHVIDSVRAVPDFAALPIIIHGYDYAIPGSPDDPRDPIYAAPDQWLGQPLTSRGITNPELQREIIVFLINSLYDMLHEVAGNSAQTHVHVVDVRGTLPKKEDWADEIHGTDTGFGKIAARFKAVVDQAIA